MPLETQTEPILFFDGEWRFLSNFHPSAVWFEGILFPTVEHAFQAAKTLDLNQRRAIAAEPTPGRAKRAGRKLALRQDWEEIKVGVMRTLVQLKFLSSPELAVLLLSTGDSHLEEGNRWNDRLWGTVDGIGQNHLGRILMETRQILRALEGAFRQ